MNFALAQLRIWKQDRENKTDVNLRGNIDQLNEYSQDSFYFGRLFWVAVWWLQTPKATYRNYLRIEIELWFKRKVATWMVHVLEFVTSTDNNCRAHRSPQRLLNNHKV